MLRLLAPVLVVCAAIAAAPAGAAGAYSRLAARDAAACARACAEDGICMAWTYRADGACELAAIVPATAPADAAGFGLAARAPAFAQMRPLPAVPAAQTVAAPAPQPLAASAPARDLAPLQTLTPYDAPPLEPAAAEFEFWDEPDAEMALLGGPEEDEIRLRGGAPR